LITNPKQKLHKVEAELQTWPTFIEQRIQLFDQLMTIYKANLAQKERKPIKVTLPDGKTVDATSWETTPLQIALGISKGLADRVVIAKLNDEVCTVFLIELLFESHVI